MSPFVSISIISILIAIIAANLLGLWFKRKHEKNIGFPYIKEAGLFSTAERAFLEVLEQAVGEQYRVFGKVRVADIIGVRPDLKINLKKIAYKKIATRHFDFVICNKTSLSVICIVELDDKNDQQKQREARDSFLLKVCDSVSLPLLRIPAKNVYPVAAVRTSFLAALGIPDATAFAPAPQRGA